MAFLKSSPTTSSYPRHAKVPYHAWMMLISPKQFVTLSKTMAHALRHAPWEYELELDEEGWTSLDHVLDALHAVAQWQDVERGDIEAMIAVSAKKRFEVCGNRIRAVYGHSLPGRLKRTPSSPPPTLYHGTSPKAAEVILQSGLLPMHREYVHLSTGVETAKIVGKRKAKNPLILGIDARRAAQHRIRFYEGNEEVWLADEIPSRYIAVLCKACGAQKSHL